MFSLQQQIKLTFKTKMTNILKTVKNTDFMFVILNFLSTKSQINH